MSLSKTGSSVKWVTFWKREEVPSSSPSGDRQIPRTGSSGCRQENRIRWLGTLLFTVRMLPLPFSIREQLFVLEDILGAIIRWTSRHWPQSRPFSGIVRLVPLSERDAVSSSWIWVYSVKSAICPARVAASCVTAWETAARALASADIAAYDANRKLLYNTVTAAGFSAVYPEGAFYLWMRAPGGDDKALCEKAKAYNLLLVPGSSFAGPGSVRLAYCVSPDMIRRSAAAFEKLAKEFHLK